MFYEKPFIELNDSGIDGVFPGKDADIVYQPDPAIWIDGRERRKQP